MKKAGDKLEIYRERTIGKIIENMKFSKFHYGKEMLIPSTIKIILIIRLHD